jgi:hypothetical protein
MKFIYKNIIEKPVILLIIFNILVGLFTYRDFGLTWDEPYFYSYGDALGYAYSPSEWFSGDFDLYNSYGASAEDHKTRGPAYLLLARTFVYGLNALGSDSASAWHLVNFLFFQLGIYFLYRISKRWMSTSAAFFAATFFSFQPMLWGHAFINPKDPPFLTFFLASLCLGFEMVDAIVQDTNDKTKKILLASFVLGIATSIRIIGPLAGILIFVYFFVSLNEKNNWIAWRSFIYYGAGAIIVMIATWPFLWDDLFSNFVNVFIRMSDNPANLRVLFGGIKYSASELPRRYLPTIMALTLTEPTWILFGFGFIAGYWKLLKNRAVGFSKQITSLSMLLVYFLLILAYVLIRKPAMYDGMRHFLFILPPIFIFIGFAYELIVDKLSIVLRSQLWLYAALGVVLILPGIKGIVNLHPYEYTYYNSFTSGTNGAFRTYETDYWLTCYKEAVEELNRIAKEASNIYLFREAHIAARYENNNFKFIDIRNGPIKILSGDYVIINSRTNEDLAYVINIPVILEIKRENAIFCTIKQAP